MEMFLVNSAKHLGTEVTPERMKNWSDAMDGHFDKSFQDRAERLRDVQQFHVIGRVKHPKMFHIHVCNCVHYFKHLWCDPSVCFQTDFRYDVDTKTIGKRRINSKRQREKDHDMYQFDAARARIQAEEEHTDGSDIMLV
jgi:hypothetical protein